MAREGSVLFSVITPSTGRRPKGLQMAVNSVDASRRYAGLARDQVEILVGFDGVRGKRPVCDTTLKCVDLPEDNNWGNGIRQMLLKMARGERILFLDDDNALKPQALARYLEHPADLVIARIDTQLAFDQPVLPERMDDPELVRHCNIDPLCLCATRDLVVARCQGWLHRGHKADYQNMLHYFRRAQSVVLLDEVVGIYDAGRNLDRTALSRRQQDIFEHIDAEQADMLPSCESAAAIG